MVRSLVAGSAIELEPDDVHVWRVELSRPAEESFWRVLSSDEQERAARFHFPEHRDAFVVAHGMLRHILSGYGCGAAGALRYATAEFGKPSLDGGGDVRFNLSHSGELALVAVAREREVGVDVEQWKEDIEHLDLAGYVFSPAERETLRGLGEEERVAGFFAAWSRKEAYIKASGHGITRGLDHFDVTLAPGSPARLLDDRNDAGFAERWVMRDVAVPKGYSAALVVAAPVNDVVLINAA